MWVGFIHSVEDPTEHKGTGREKLFSLLEWLTWVVRLPTISLEFAPVVLLVLRTGHIPPAFLGLQSANHRLWGFSVSIIMQVISLHQIQRANGVIEMCHSTRLWSHRASILKSRWNGL